MPEPCLSVLDCPSFGNNLKIRLDPFRNIDFKAELFLNSSYKGLPITGISAEFLDCPVQTASFFSGAYAGFGVVNVDGMDSDGQKIARHVRYGVAFAAFRFSPSMLRSPLA